MDDVRIANARIASSPLGPIRVSAGADGVVALAFETWNDVGAVGVTSVSGARPDLGSPAARTIPPDDHADDTAGDPSTHRTQASAAAAIAADAAAQVRAYLAGERDTINVPVDWSVLEPFQADVLRLVAAIPAGETRTYGQLAAALGRPGGARAVGRANAMNPMPLVLPCHRVVAADGGMGGYSGPGGVETKAWLLRREGAALL